MAEETKNQSDFVFNASKVDSLGMILEEIENKALSDAKNEIKKRGCLPSDKSYK